MGLNGIYFIYLEISRLYNDLKLPLYEPNWGKIDPYKGEKSLKSDRF